MKEECTEQCDACKLKCLVKSVKCIVFGGNKISIAQGDKKP